jgi:hypothetical protein
MTPVSLVCSGWVSYRHSCWHGRLLSIPPPGKRLRKGGFIVQITGNVPNRICLPREPGFTVTLSLKDEFSYLADNPLLETLLGRYAC